MIVGSPGSALKVASQKNTAITVLMVTWLILGVLCLTDAIRPSAPPSAGKKGLARRPFRKLWYRHLDDDQDDDRRQGKIPSVVGSFPRKRRAKLQDDLSFNTDDLPGSVSKEALAEELSSLMEGIETLAEEVERTRSIPPIASGKKAGQTSEKKDGYKIKTVQELRQAVLDEGKELRELELAEDAQLLVNATAHELLNHEVVQLIAKRFRTGSTPGNRGPDDTARLALAIEGGGMRGAVSAGMASAIASLGLCDSFDAVYGSSAGSVIGAYMISRQMCMDVYVDILPAAKRTFVCTKRLMSSLAITAVDMFLQGVKRRTSLNRGENIAGTVSVPQQTRFTPRTPGMNISFVLDGIMDEEHGIRPLDMESFLRNDQKQPLRVASSYAKDGKLYYKCFGSDHYYGEQPAVREDGKRKGLFACLQPSMTVPGATGPPVRLKTHCSDEVLPYFDAFCFEPLPYRSAVEEGATHVLVLASRPEGFQPKTKPGVYEQAIAPLYFKSHGEPEVAEFFSRGGQQYIYLEDMLTLEEGKVAGMNKMGPIPVPPAKILYGVEQDHESHRLAVDRDEAWNKAHLLPLKVPLGTPELATLEQDQDAVREAVRGGFAAAFDILAPAIGLNTHGQLTGAEVAALIFPKKAGMLDEIILKEKLRVDGDDIEHRRTFSSVPKPVDDSPAGRRRKIREKRDRFLKNARHVLRVVARNKRRKKAEEEHVLDASEVSALPNLALSGGSSGVDSSEPLNLDSDQKKAKHLLNALPGLKSGRMSQLAANLHVVASSSDSDDLTSETESVPANADDSSASVAEP